MTITAIALLVGYLMSRETVRVEGDLSKAEVKEIVSGIRGWSEPRLFRDITISKQRDRTVHAMLEESADYKSIMVFTNDGSGWKQQTRFLLKSDADDLVSD